MWFSMVMHWLVHNQKTVWAGHLLYDIVNPSGGGGDYSNIFLYTYAWTTFGVQNNEFQYFWGVFRKMNIL